MKYPHACIQPYLFHYSYSNFSHGMGFGIVLYFILHCKLWEIGWGFRSRENIHHHQSIMYSLCMAREDWHNHDNTVANDSWWPVGPIVRHKCRQLHGWLTYLGCKSIVVYLPKFFTGMPKFFTWVYPGKTCDYLGLPMYRPCKDQELTKFAKVILTQNYKIFHRVGIHTS